MSRHLPPLNSLRSFAAAARAGSFTRASEELFVTQGAVSRQVKQLESWLGKPLFLRTPQGLELTEAGRQFSLAINSAFGQIQSAADAITRSSQRHLLKINLPPTFATRWLAPRLAAFRKIYPSIDFSFTTDRAWSLRDLRNVDAAVVFTDHDWDHCESHRLRLEQHVLVTSPSLWNQGLPPSLRDCTLLHILDGEARLPVWERWCESHGVENVDTRAGLAFSTLDQVINAALAGTGAAVVDEIMIQPELQCGALRRLNPLTSCGPMGYWFVSLTQDSERRACVQLFHSWIGEQFCMTPQAALSATVTEEALL